MQTFFSITSAVRSARCRLVQSPATFRRRHHLLSLAWLNTMPSDSTSTSNVWDSIIVGAGISGLSAGSVLAKAGHRVLVLEARSRIGGRIHTYEDDLPCAIDLGARFVSVSAITSPIFSSLTKTGSFIHGIDGNPLVQLAREQNLVCVVIRRDRNHHVVLIT